MGSLFTRHEEEVREPSQVDTSVYDDAVIQALYVKAPEAPCEICGVYSDFDPTLQVCRKCRGPIRCAE